MTNRRTFLKAASLGAALGSGSAAQAQAPGLVLPPPPPVTLPIVGRRERFPVRRIYCVGRNYLAHIREMGNDERVPPFFFAKHRDMLVQNGASVPYPSLTKDYHHEIELVAAMKSGGMNIPISQALTHVYGYATGLDMTRRDLQRAAQNKMLPWEIGKSFDFSAPCTAITPVAQNAGPYEGRISLAIDGQIKQDADMRYMIWDVAEIIHHLSTQVEIQAGDLIYTGTPEGVGPVVSGQTMVGKIDGLETLTIKVV
jgi:fumarylpyruvate hydrolase